jgi:hypothetical protein
MFRSILLFSLVSLCAAFGLLVLGSAAGYEEFRGGYAVLSVDDSIEDKALLEILDSGKGVFELGSLISESGQWVMLDNFGSLEQVPLDKYSSRVFSFDPRNDGYAEKLKEVFVRDGKRFVYVPLKTGNWTVNILDKQFTTLLKNVNYSVNYYGIGKPLFLFFIVYIAASVCLLFICYAKRNTQRGASGIVVLIPVFSSLAFFGASGIAAAALLFGLFFLLREPLNEFIMLPGLFSKGKTGKNQMIYREIIKPYKLYWVLLGLFAIALGIIVIFSQLKLLFLLALTAAALLVFFFFSRTMVRLDGNHTRFTPVMIVKRRIPEFAFSFYMLPFAAAAFVAVFSAPHMSGPLVSDEKFDNIVEEMDYYAHLTYQATFSTRQLGSPAAAYPDYILENDGLPSAGKADSVNFTFNKNDFPPFPLKNLMEFFKGVNSGGKAGGPGSSLPKPIDEMPLFVLLLFIIPGFFIRRMGENTPEIDFSSLKKISSKPRYAFVFGGKNQMRIRKDA